MPTPQRAQSWGMWNSTAFRLPRCAHAQRRAEEAITSGGNFRMSYCAASGGGEWEGEMDWGKAHKCVGRGQHFGRGPRCADRVSGKSWQG